MSLRIETLSPSLHAPPPVNTGRAKTKPLDVFGRAQSNKTWEPVSKENTSSTLANSKKSWGKPVEKGSVLESSSFPPLVSAAAKKDKPSAEYTISESTLNFVAEWKTQTLSDLQKSKIATILSTIRD